MTDAAPEHTTIAGARRLHELATLYPVLQSLLPAGTAPTGNTKIKTSRGQHLPTPADLHTLKVILQIDDYALELHRTLHRTPHYQPPAPFTTPAILEHVADHHIGHFHTGHRVNGLAFNIAAARLAKLAHDTAYPSGRRWIPLKVQCVERIPDPNNPNTLIACEGEYAVLLSDESHGRQPDMICLLSRDLDRNHERPETWHRITPLEWQRAARKSGYNPDLIRERLKIERANR